MQSIIDTLVINAQSAAEDLYSNDQDQIDYIVEAMSFAGRKNAEALGFMAFEETQMGVAEDKVFKNIVASEIVYNQLKDKKSVGVINEDNGIIEIAEPYGVVVAVTPTTNPTSTVIFKCLIALKGRNSIIFAFHPRAQKCSEKAAEIMRDAAVSAGAPLDCIQWIKCPSVEATNLLMNHPGISLIVATGGDAMVKAAYSSGHPAYGVGPGNVPVYIEKSANINMAVDDIIASKIFDNGTTCASEQNLIFDDSAVASRTLDRFKKQGAYLATNEDKIKLANIMFDQERGVPSAAIVGQSAVAIADLAGINVPKSTKLILVPLDGVGDKDKLSSEKLSPVLGYITVNSKNEAIDIANKMLKFKGAGHTASVFTSDNNIFLEYAVSIPANRVLMNQPSLHGALGYLYNSMNATFTLGCGSKGRNITSDNIGYKHLINIKRAARRIVPETYSE